MKVRLQPPNTQDVFHLVAVKNFMSVVDEWDIAQRHSKNIENAYHEHWLTGHADGSYDFHAPEFYLKNGVARFINGRHRTLVLSYYLAEIPMALTNIDRFPIDQVQPLQTSINVLKQISIRQLAGDEVFEFPDLPVRYLGFDANIGK
jgi:hypothetical protein